VGSRLGGPGLMYVGMVFSWAATEDLVPLAVVKGTFRLASLMGSLRQGAISSTTCRAEEALRLVEEIGRAKCSPVELATLDQVRAYVKDRGGIVVVTSAPGEPV